LNHCIEDAQLFSTSPKPPLATTLKASSLVGW
jgi:hypothetical protein